ncbi:MAG: hypothetical protein ACTSWW_02745 [Promethearchaeota archaeon]
MGKKKKVKDQAPSPNFEKIIKGLENLQAQLAKARNLENLERIKFTLIKLFDQLKTNPNTDELNEKRVELLKECNLNLQFLDRDENIWVLFKQHQVHQAYDQSILMLKTMNDHPQRYWIKPWVRNIATQTMQKIADLVTSLPAGEHQHIQKPEQGQTFVNPREGTVAPFPHKSSSISALPSPTQETFRPKDSQQPFEDRISPFPPIEATLLDSPTSRGDTFKPFPSSSVQSRPFPTQSESDLPWKQESSQEPIDTVIPPNQNESTNSIQTFWSKDGEKTQKIKPKEDDDSNSNDPTHSKTKKIAQKEPN